MNIKKLLIIPSLFLPVAVFSQSKSGFNFFDVNTGLANGFPQYVTAFDTNVCFFANDGTHGWELFMTNGKTPAHLVSDINPATASVITPSTYTRPAASLNGVFYFSANNGSLGQELFSYTGSGIPVLSADMEIGANSSNPDNFVSFNNKLYFTATTSGFGTELWSYDPISSSHRITDIRPGPDSSITGNLTVYNSQLFFTAKSLTAGNELFAYDPVSDTVRLIYDICPGTAASDPLQLTVVNGKLYFSADDGVHGRELFGYDGINPPQRLTDVIAGLSSGLPAYNQPIIAGFNGRVYFSATTGNNEYHLYYYDPANSNIGLACKVNNNGSSDPLWLTVYNNALYFSANDTTGFNDFELWSYNGSTLSKMIDLCSTSGSQPYDLATIGSSLYFAANNCDSIGEELFRYNPTEVSVSKVESFLTRVSVWPNPVSDQLFIELQSNDNPNYSVELFDITGRTIYSSLLKDNTALHKIEIPTRNFPSGCYYYCVTNANGAFIKGKVIKY